MDRTHDRPIRSIAALRCCYIEGNLFRTLIGHCKFCLQLFFYYRQRFMRFCFGFGTKVIYLIVIRRQRPLLIERGVVRSSTTSKAWRMVTFPSDMRPFCVHVQSSDWNLAGNRVVGKMKKCQANHGFNRRMPPVPTRIGTMTTTHRNTDGRADVTTPTWIDQQERSARSSYWY